MSYLAVLEVAGTSWAVGGSLMATNENSHQREMAYRIFGEFRLFDFTMLRPSILSSEPVRLIYFVLAIDHF